MGLGQWQDRVGWAWDSDKIGLDGLGTVTR